MKWKNRKQKGNNRIKQESGTLMVGSVRKKAVQRKVDDARKNINENRRGSGSDAGRI